MLLDNFFLPLAEMAFAVGGPLLFTLKALQLATSVNTDSTSQLRTQRMLVFWLCYWLGAFFLGLMGVNSHAMCLFALLYAVQSPLVLTQLLHLYSRQLLLYTSQGLRKVANIHKSEAELDELIEHWGDRLSFDSQFMSELIQNGIQVSQSPQTSITLSPQQRPYPETVPNEFIPLEIQSKMDGHRRKRGSGNRGASGGFSLGKAVSNIRTMSDPSNLVQRDINTQPTLSHLSQSQRHQDAYPQHSTGLKENPVPQIKISSDHTSPPITPQAQPQSRVSSVDKVFQEPVKGRWLPF